MVYRKLPIWTIGAVSLLAAGAAGAQGNGAFKLHDGDRVVFYGDSITEQRLYTTITETYVATRFPNLNVSFVHSGWGGDRVSGGGGGPIDIRLKRDVLAYNPTVMTIMLGMNDASYRAFDQQIFDTYSTGYKHILDTVKAADPDVRFTLIQPSPYDDVTRAPGFPGGYNATLLKYADFVKSLAPAYNATVADFNTPVVAMLEKAKATNSDLAQKIIPDRVHPSYAGHLIMAEALLKSWNAPAVVTKVQIDAKGKKVAAADNTQVSGLKTGSVISWTQNDRALPMPVESGEATDLSLKSSDFTESLNQEPLIVTGLKAGSYTLTIDGEEIGDFNAQDLAAGVNLATLPTPMLVQATNVRQLTQQHNDQHARRWRDIQMQFQDSKNDAVQKALPAFLAALDAEEADTAAVRHTAAQPKPHQYTLTPAASTADASLLLKPLNGSNLALGKTYASSDPNTYNYGIGALTDGSWVPDGHTFASGDSAAFPKTATVDLGSVQQIGTVIIGVPPFGSTKNVKVSISADGQKFTSVGKATFTLRKEEKRRFSFPGAPARYIRLTYTNNYTDEVGYSANFVFTTEVEAYAP